MNDLGNFKALAIGSLPYQDGRAAWDLTMKYFPEIPNWPQLPKRKYFENMYVQFSEHIPGRNIDIENERFYIDNTQHLDLEMEKFYNDYLSNEIDLFKVSRDYCEGLFIGLELSENEIEFFKDIKFIKGQITGPVSFGLQVVDENKKPIYYNEMFHDILVKNLERKAQWQEKMLKKINNNVVISVDEPYLSSVGSGVINLNREQIIKDLEAVFKGLDCLKATHCCGNTDWTLLMATSADILLFDAYNYSKNLALFSSDLDEFLTRGGLIGWGIVPSVPSELENASEENLISRLEEGIDVLVGKGIERDSIIHQSLLTPSCGLGPLTEPQAKDAMILTESISKRMIQKYELEN